jgi:hypothetical protein
MVEGGRNDSLIPEEGRGKHSPRLGKSPNGKVNEGISFRSWTIELRHRFE